MNAVSKRMILIFAALILIQALFVWGIRSIIGNTPTGSIPGIYALLIGSSMAALPLVGLSMIGIVAFAVVWIVRRARQPQVPNPALQIALILLAATVGFCAAGFPSILSPATHEASLQAGSHVYHLARLHGLADSQDVLFECDSSGLVCAALYKSGDTCQPSELTFDSSANAAALSVDGCGASHIFTTPVR